MELDARPKINSTISTLNKCILAIQEIRTIENRKKSLEEKLVDSALGEHTDSDVSKEIIGLEKVLEAMNERLDQNIIVLGGQMKSLKAVYRQKSEKFKIGKIGEAVPR